MPNLPTWLADKSLELILLPVLGAVGTAVGCFLSGYLKARSDAVKVKKHMDILDRLIAGEVDAMNEDKVDSLKGTADWTDEKHEEIFQEVKRRVMSQLKSETYNVLHGAYADWGLFIEAQIKLAVRVSKDRAKGGSPCG